MIKNLQRWNINKMDLLNIILILSLVVNIIIVPYAIRCARRLLVVASNMNSLQEGFTVFQAHVETLHESEMFYGDTSLRSLMDHTKVILEELDKHEDIYALVIDDTELEEDIGFGDYEEKEETPSTN